MTKEKYTKEEIEKMFGLDGEVDPAVKAEYDMLDAMKLAHWNETGTPPPDTDDSEVELYAKKIKETEALMDVMRDFSDEDIQIGTNETGLPDVMFF